MALSPTQINNILNQQNIFAHLDGEDIKRIYNEIWQNINREDNLVNNRLMAAIVLSAGVLAAIAFIVAAAVGSSFEPERAFVANLFRSLMMFLVFGLCVLSIVMTNATIEGIRAAQEQIDYLKGEYYKFTNHFEIFGLPRPFGDKSQFYRGMRAAILFPRVIRILWVSGALVSFAGFVFYAISALNPIVDVVSEKSSPTLPKPCLIECRAAVDCSPRRKDCACGICSTQHVLRGRH
jgi:magnesium-transporting ATPase (P-type)